MTLPREALHGYQRACVEFVQKKERCALFLAMGLGKTATALTSAADFLNDFRVLRVLIVAPLRVANTVWHNEVQKWDHLKHLRISVCTGPAKQRLAALEAPADIYVINRENVSWLVDNFRGNRWKWEMLIVDESSSFKSHSSQRFQALKMVMDKIECSLLLTGTPAPNSIMDLWAQMFLIDRGQRLGRTITAYRNRFFRRGWDGFSWETTPNAPAEVHRLISDVCISLKAEDHLDLPERIDLVEAVTLPPKLMDKYEELEKEFVLTLQATEIEALTAATLAGKLLQFCNGAVYDADKIAHEIHDLKIAALKEIVEDNPGENFLVAYNYQSDLARLQAAFPQAVKLDKQGKELDRWNKGQVKMLLAHPASAGHGLNAQHGGNVIVWFGLNWSLELYQQFNARLHRQGQRNNVRIFHLVAKGCIDEKVLAALDQKAETQEQLLRFLKASY